MQQTLIQLNSVAAIVTVIAFKLHNKNADIDLERFLPKDLSDSPSPAVDSFKGQSIDKTIENLLHAVSKNQSRKNLAINNYVLQGAQKRFLWAQATAVI